MVNEETVDWDHCANGCEHFRHSRGADRHLERRRYDFQDVADVIAIARIAGVDRVGLLTEDAKHLPRRVRKRGYMEWPGL